MVILMRTDLGMGAGKMASQAAHAATAFMIDYMNSAKSSDAAFHWLYVDEINDPSWPYGGMRKVVLGVKNEHELLFYTAKAIHAGLETNAVMDEKLETYTCASIGPDWDYNINPITKTLELLK